MRLLVVFVAFLFLVIVVDAWNPPFPYRLGDKIDRGILAETDFVRKDNYLTYQAAEENAKKVPLYFEKQASVLDAVEARFRQHLLAVNNASDQSAVPAEIQKAFGLESTPRSDNNQSDSSFTKLRKILNPEENPPEHLDLLVSQFKKFMSPVELTGTISESQLKQLDPNLSRNIVIIEPKTGKESEPMTAENIQLSYFLNESGRLGKSWLSYPELLPLRPYIEHWITEELPQSLQYAENLTESRMNEARENTEAVTIKYSMGTTLIPPGQSIDQEGLDLLRAEYQTMIEQISFQRHLVRTGAVAMLLLVLVILINSYLLTNYPHILRSARQLLLFLSVIILAIFLARQFSVDPWRAELIPLTVTVMMFAVVYNQILAAVIGFALSLVITVSTTNDLSHFVQLIGVSTTAIIPLSKVPSRATLIKVGFLAGFVSFLIYWGTGILGHGTLRTIFTDIDLFLHSLKGFLWCLVAGYLVAGSLPFIEATFGIVTNISLLEMSNPSHPLLQELVRRAPGTYNHSITVASIGETAAESIGANGLLVRVGAYFHDIGKMLKPEYFVENKSQEKESKHEKLSPSMSTLIIIGHVKDGVDLAKQHHLPQPLIDFIEQHHGTTRVEYFYQMALNQAEEEPENQAEVEESLYRYPGPKPQSRESGVMMLADSVESASRTLSDPTPKRIESLVESITMKKLLDGQFDDCYLTLREIHQIQDSLTKSLIGIYHGRIKYPDQK